MEVSGHYNNRLNMIYDPQNIGLDSLICSVICFGKDIVNIVLFCKDTLISIDFHDGTNLHILASRIITKSFN